AGGGAGAGAPGGGGNGGAGAGSGEPPVGELLLRRLSPGADGLPRRRRVRWALLSVAVTALACAASLVAGFAFDWFTAAPVARHQKAVGDSLDHAVPPFTVTVRYETQYPMGRHPA
ncbi:hypothetical protein JFN87_31780, partial [Streptomyces bomunensis]|nr:hypothetical protein [Streptomyces montanisoli]